MNGRRFRKLPRRERGSSASHRVRYRPRLDLLEDRTLLTLTTFMIDPTLSSISLQGSSVSYNGVPIPVQEQGPGSLTTTYEGPMVTDVDVGGGTITFLGSASGTAVAADISGQWRPGIGGTPGTTDDANYGGQVGVLGSVLYAAIRDVVTSASTDGPVPLSDQGGGTYTYPSNQTLTIDQGNLDYETPDSLYGSGRTAITGSAQNQATDGTLHDNGDGTYTLTVPVHLTLHYDLGSGVAADL